MKRKILTGFLTLVLILQAFIPSFAYAIEEKPIDNKLTTKKVESSGGNLVTIGKLTKDNYPEIDPATLLRVAKEERNKLNGKKMGGGETPFSTNSPYIPGQQPGDSEKPKYVAKIEGEVKARGLDGGSFNWNQILGNQPIKLELRQLDKSKSSQPGNPIGETGLKLILEVTKAGEFKLTDPSGNPTYLPLFTSEGNPYEYQVQIDRKSYENVELILSTNAETPGSSFKPEGNLQVATIHFNIGIQQLASTKFVSQWHTGLAEGERPQIEGKFDMGGEDEYTYFDFPKNDTSQTIFREGYDENFTENEDKDFWLMPDSDLDRNPQTVEVKTDTDGLTFNTTDKTVTSGDHKFKYDFTYDVINGGKLTMTEVIPVTFNANGGKFASITGPNAEQKIVKEVEYDGTLTDVAEEPRKENESFKGWSLTAAGAPLSDVDFNNAVKNIKEAKTFYAIYGKANAKISYLDLDGQKINDKFKLAGQDYPEKKEGKAGAAVDTSEYTGKTAPKFIGYKFNRVELNPKDAKYAFENQATIKIYYEKLPDIIPDKTPDTDDDKPAGYVTVKFLPGDNGTLSGETKFYVNPKAGKTNADLTEPSITANTGYTVASPKWNPDFEAATPITQDATYTAQYTAGQDVIPVPNPSNPPEKPEGYVTITFDLDGKGTTTDTKVFFVNPHKYVILTPPTVTGINNYTHKTGDDAWSPKFTALAKYTEYKTFTAQYDFTKDVVPQGPGDDKPVVPNNYVKVTFKKGDHGIISSEETTIYWVNPDKKVTLTAPDVTANVEYKHSGWDKALKATFNQNTDITAKYLKKVETTNPNDTENYVKVDFKAETHGNIKAGETKEYWVLKNETIELKTPAVEAKPNYAFKNWDPAVKTSYNTDTTHKAVFVYTGDNVVPQKPGDEKPDVPSDFVKVIFKDGKWGYIANTETVTYWVKPNVEVTVTAPKVTANAGYKHVAWTYSGKETTTLESVTDTFTAAETTITAKYLKKVLTVDPSDTDNYVKVTFDKGANGTIASTETTTYWVLKNTDVTVPAPEVTPKSGYKFTEWNPPVKTNYDVNTTHTAQYKAKDKVVETDPNDPDYIKVTFNANGGKIGTENKKDLWVLKGIATFADAKAKVATPTWTGETFKGWHDAATGGNAVEDTKVLSTAGEIFYAIWTNNNAMMNFTAKKVWENLDGVNIAEDEYPTMKFTLWRAWTIGDPGEEQPSDEAVQGEQVAEIDGNNLEAVWENLPKANSNGDLYTYYIKEEFKNPDIMNDNWITGTMPYEYISKIDYGTAVAPTERTITNTLKTVPEDGQTPDPDKNFVGKLTVKKVLENEPVPAPVPTSSKGPNRAPAAPIKFKIKVTGPYGYNQEIELEAGKEKELKDLAYGEYTVEEIETNNYTPKYVEGDYTAGTSTLSKEPIKVEVSKVNATKTVTVVNQNLEKPDPNFVTLEATKIWKNGPATDHNQVTINVFRQVEGGQKEEVQVNPPVKLKVTRDASDINKFTYTWTNLPKHDKNGKEYTYTVEEDGATSAPNASGTAQETTVTVNGNTYVVTQEGNTITNTYKVPQTDEDVIGKKIWSGVPDGTIPPTVKLELWRKTSDADQGVKVEDATDLDANNQANFGKQDKTDANGIEYTYFVKEVDENGNAFNDPDYTSVVDGLTVTNTKIAKDGKLTITKKLENLPVRMMMRGPARNADPIKFKFTVTKPDGSSEVFELAANESKTLVNLAYGEYTIKETDTKGYTPFYAKGNEEAKQTQEFKVTINSADEVKVTVTNKNIINQNDLTVRATKIWVGGPVTDHKAVSLILKRLSAKEGSSEENVSNQYSVETINNTSDSITYVWKNLPKHDGEGYPYTYRVEELGTASDPTSTDKIYIVGNNKYVSKIENDGGNTANETTSFKITNTYKVPQTEDDVIATKQWVGVPAGTITPQVKFQLQRTANGVTEDVGQAMDLTNNKVNFGKQDKTDANGNVYVYSVIELDAQGNLFSDAKYTSEVNGLNVRNTYKAPEVKYTVTYVSGSSTATGTMAADTGVSGLYTVRANGFTNPGYTFKGWMVDNGPKIIGPGATINVTADVTLTAQWERTTTPPTPPTPPTPDYPNYPERPYIPSYPEVRYETIVQEKIVKVPVSNNAYFKEVRYMQGFKGKFRPFDGLTRAEAAQILANALKEDGYKYDPNYKISYKDIGNAWYTEAVKIVTQANVFKGYDDGNFKPQENITRAEWIGTLKRFQELSDLSGNHMNLREGHWAMAEIEAAYQAGWLAIYSDGLADFKADEFIPRQEVAAVSNKAFERVLDKTYIKRNDKALVNYKDINDKMWSYEDILCASNTFLHDKKLYRAHGIDMSNEIFNINVDGFTITKDKFQRIER